MPSISLIHYNIKLFFFFLSSIVKLKLVFTQQFLNISKFLIRIFIPFSWQEFKRAHSGSQSFCPLKVINASGANPFHPDDDDDNHHNDDHRVDNSSNYSNNCYCNRNSINREWNNLIRSCSGCGTLRHRVPLRHLALSITFVTFTLFLFLFPTSTLNRIVHTK